MVDLRGHYEITVEDPEFDHRFAANAQHEQLTVTCEVGRNWQQFFDVLLGQDISAGCNVADERDVAARAPLHDDAAVGVVANFDGTRFGGVAAEVAEALKRVEVTVDRGRRSETDRIADFANRRRVPALTNLLLDELEDASLAVTDLRSHTNTIRITISQVKHLYCKQLFDKVANSVDSLDIRCLNDERSFPEHLFVMGVAVGTNGKGAPIGNAINLPSVPVGGAITMTATLYTTSNAGAAWETRGARVPNYHLRRTVAAFIITFIVLLAAIASVTVVGALTGLGGRPAAASETLPASAPIAASSAIHVAEPGDSLWSIADFHRGDIGRDRYVDALISLNGGTAIQAGQAVHLP